MKTIAVAIMLCVSQAARSKETSVDPAQVLLRDLTGQVVHGTATLAPGRDSGKATVTSGSESSTRLLSPDMAPNDAA
jgi:hypothetical protein